jgi:hypothetical protein
MFHGIYIGLQLRVRVGAFPCAQLQVALGPIEALMDADGIIPLLVGLCIFVVICVGTGKVISRALMRLVAAIITPAHCRKYHDYKDTQAYRSLKDAGYSVSPNWRSTAVSSIEKERKKN